MTNQISTRQTLSSPALCLVERTISWLEGLRRMRVRYDRFGVIRDAFNTLAANVICFRIWCHDAA